MCFYGNNAFNPMYSTTAIIRIGLPTTKPLMLAARGDDIADLTTKTTMYGQAECIWRKSHELALQY